MDADREMTEASRRRGRSTPMDQRDVAGGYETMLAQMYKGYSMPGVRSTSTGGRWTDGQYAQWAEGLAAEWDDPYRLMEGA